MTVESLHMAKIPEHILSEIQDKCDIVEVISGYIPLKSAGRNFKTNCPFHHEKTPSFIVSPDKQIYHCFGCNSGGNVFNFVKEYEKIDFIEAVKILAEKACVKLPQSKNHDSGDVSLTSSIYTINDIAANFYNGLLEKSPLSSEVRLYIEKRGLDSSVIKKFSLGYANSSWRSYADYLSGRGIDLNIAVKAGLVCRGKEGSYYDLFRHRLIFPIRDARGKVLGFGARVLDDSMPKYINTPETAVYKKGYHLYGLNFAKTDIREKGFAIICEGYLDVITSHQYAINNTISSLGTALTVEQIRLLRRYTHNVVMVYDADQAGELASMRGLDLFLEEGMNVKIATLDSGHDPDSFIRKFGPAGFDTKIKEAKNLFVYKLGVLQKRFDTEEPEAKARIVKEMLATICKVRDAVVKAEYIKKLSHELSVREDAIWEELKKTKKGRYTQNIENDIRTIRKPIDITPAERILIKLMLEDINVVRIVKDSLQPVDFKTPDIRKLVEVLFNIDFEKDLLDAPKIMNCMEDKASLNLITFIMSDEMEIKNKMQNITDCIRIIKKEKKNELLKDIQNRLILAQKEGYEDEARSLLEEFNMLIKKRED